jgi:macrocin-O-methyltransferase TylF-like protien
MIKANYIELLKNVLTDTHRIECEELVPIEFKNATWKQKLLIAFDKYFQKRNYRLCSVVAFNSQNRLEGKDWPLYAETMIGMKRLENIQFCVEQIMQDNVPGDLIETGVWRGGAVIFMKALLENAGIKNRVVWVADSFEGLPEPDEQKYQADKGDLHYTQSKLGISMEQVQKNFEKYGLMDDGVKFLKGWFKDTLPLAPIEQLALLRLDGDMYESTMDGLTNLYPKLSVGGFIIIDDWGAIPACKQAVIDYRQKFDIVEEIKPIDWTGVYWRKTK